LEAKLHRCKRYLDVLTPESVVVDIGAHKGKFSRHILESYDCRVIAYEPCLWAIRDYLSQLHHPNFEFHQKAVGSKKRKSVMFYEVAAPEKFRGEGNTTVPTSREVIDSYSVSQVSLQSILLSLPRVDLLKLNCEGAEIDIILSTPPAVLQVCKQIFIAFHKHRASDLSIEAMSTRIKACRRRLENLGYASRIVHKKHPDILFYRGIS